jgi:hypothetical protein
MTIGHWGRLTHDFDHDVFDIAPDFRDIQQRDPNKPVANQQAATRPMQLQITAKPA